MGVLKTVKKAMTSGFSVKRWAGTEQIAHNGSVIRNLFKQVFKSPHDSVSSNDSPDTFEACLQKYNLTEKDLKKRMKTCLQVALFCALIALVVVVYMFYMFSHDRVLGGLVCGMLAVVAFAHAFREHFNYFQMKQRRLGCTFKEWFAFTIRGGK